MKNLISQLCVKEKTFPQEELLNEIYLLLKEQFVAKIYCDGKKIHMEFLNGQCFNLSLVEA